MSFAKKLVAAALLAAADGGRRRLIGAVFGQQLPICEFLVVVVGLRHPVEEADPRRRSLGDQRGPLQNGEPLVLDLGSGSV
jgi:hypothetical protein